MAEPTVGLVNSPSDRSALKEFTPFGFEVGEARAPSSTEESINVARIATAQKLALYGSIDKWPTLALDARRFATCTCGHSRTQSHRMIGTDRGPCTAKHCECRLFEADRPKKATS